MGKENEMGLPKIFMRYTGLFDFDALYIAIIDWAKNYGYMWHEQDYKHKVPSPEGAEQEFTWVMLKEVTEYIGHRILIVVHIWDLLEVEVDTNGKKKSLTNARFQLSMEGTLIVDWQKKFAAGGRFAQLLGKWYQKIYRKEIESVYGDQLYYRMWDLHALMKKFFDLQSKKYEYKGYLKES